MAAATIARTRTMERSTPIMIPALAPPDKPPIKQDDNNNNLKNVGNYYFIEMMLWEMLI